MGGKYQTIMPNKVYIQGMVDKEVADEFFLNIIHAYGFKHGAKGVSLEQALRLFNNYFRVFDKYSMADIAEELGIEPWELGERMIKRGVEVYRAHGFQFDRDLEGSGVDPEVAHREMAERYTRDYKKKKKE